MFTLSRVKMTPVAHFSWGSNSCFSQLHSHRGVSRQVKPLDALCQLFSSQMMMPSCSAMAVIPLQFTLVAFTIFHYYFFKNPPNLRLMSYFQNPKLLLKPFHEKTNFCSFYLANYLKTWMDLPFGNFRNENISYVHLKI